MPKPKRNADCHPDRSHCSLGLCKTCYENYRNSLNREKNRIKAVKIRLRDKDKIEDRRLRKVYGISLKEYEDKKAHQEGKCFLCGNPGNHLDHNHKTLRLRHFLCYRCNSGIGYFKEDINLLEKTIEYLRSFE